ncbi:MAG: HAMP domain-containing protein, partial [Candidatus Riflebacteria bacterium]|nr:HAMP domain-containing protein [Candidatus Riflebacteria bacterium]
MIKSAVDKGRDWLSFALIAFGVPILIALLGYLGTWEERSELRQQTIEMSLDDTLAALAADVEPERFFCRLLRNVERLVFSGQNSQKSFRQIRDNLRNRFPGVFSFTFLDGKGGVVSELCDDVVPSRMLRRFFEAYIRFLRGDSKALDSESFLIRNFFGIFTPVGSQIHGNIYHVASSHMKRYLYLSQPYDGGMLIVHLNHVQDWEAFPLRDRVYRANLRAVTRHSRLRLALCESSDSIISRAVPPGLNRYLLEKSRLRYEQTNEQVINDNGFVWKWRRCGPSFLLAAVLRANPVERLKEERQFVLLTAIALSVILAYLTRTAFYHDFGRIPSIRLRLIAGFIFATGLPLIVMATTAGTYVAERRQVLERIRHSEVGQTLQSFDRMLPMSFGALAEKLGKEFSPLCLPDISPFASAAAFITPLSKKFSADLEVLYDPDGRPRLELRRGTKLALDGKWLNLWAKLARQILQNMNTGERSLAALQSSTLQVGSSSVNNFPEAAEMHRDSVNVSSSTFTADPGAGSDLLLPRMSGMLCRVARFTVSGVDIIVSGWPMIDSRRYNHFLVLMVWTGEKFVRDFLNRRLANCQRGLTDTELWAWNPDSPTSCVPVRSRVEPWVKPFLSRIRVGGSTIRIRAQGDNGEVRLITAVRAENITGYHLIAVGNDRMIRAELQALGWRFSFAGLTMSLISLTIGILLARTFLEPISKLQHGVEALSERRFAERLPEGDQGEFGDLIRAFNEMMEGFSDLEVARIVQENLFPRIPPSPGSWRIDGVSMSATELGGDYFDYLAIGERRAAIIVGDVSGHGVSAALVMAMAKALTVHPLTGL